MRCLSQWPAEISSASTRCFGIRCQQKGHLATACPLRVKQEQEQAYNTEVVDKSKIVWSHNGEINEEYLCLVCDVQGVVWNIIKSTAAVPGPCSLIGACLRTSAPMSNGSLTKVPGVGEVGILRKVLLVPQLKKDLGSLKVN